MLDFGIVVGSSGPGREVSDLAPLWEGHLDPALYSRFRFTHYDSQDELEQAFLTGEVQAMIADRNRHFPAPAGTRAKALKERWTGMLVLNGASPLFADPALRREFGLMVQTLAQSLFPRRFASWTCARTYYTPCFLPDGLLPASYYRRNDMSVLPARFAARWREQFAAHPLRLLHTPARGALTLLLDHLIQALQQEDLALEIIPTTGAADVYARVATGEFDVVPRGWAEHDDLPDGYLGAFEKQAPGAVANQPYQAFQQTIDRINDRRDALHGARYAAALRELEDTWLFVPFCQDRTRLILRSEP
ncbi:periplasmic substrate-binding domain-containing protein [Chitinimonas naiadis]